MTATCLDPDTAPGRRAHAWQSTGLDVVSDVLCNTRRCTWCGAEQYKPYGAGGRKSWKGMS